MFLFAATFAARVAFQYHIDCRKKELERQQSRTTDAAAAVEGAELSEQEEEERIDVENAPTALSELRRRSHCLIELDRRAGAGPVPYSLSELSPRNAQKGKMSDVESNKSDSPTTPEEPAAVVPTTRVSSNASAASSSSSSQVSDTRPQGIEGDTQDHDAQHGKNGVFLASVRKEWIDATFGPDFFPLETSSSSQASTSPNPPEYSPIPQPPRQGVGLSQIPSYVSYEAIIPENAVHHGKKVGVTISRIPIGLYVRHVNPYGEAYAAGVLEGSVLLDVNGLGMLGEPSKQALERIWQYEGHFPVISSSSSSTSGASLDGTDEADKGGGAGETGGVTAISDIRDDKKAWNNANGGNDFGGVRGPVALRFIKDGRIYTAMLLTKAPFGIAWAPCANFALVQRAYSFAETAGVRRGCIVAAVNGKSFRELDHQGTALEIRDLFTKGEKIVLTLAYTPAASRTGYHERQSGISSADKGSNKDGGSVSRRASGEIRDVEVRVHPVEYTIGSLLTCGANRMPDDTKQNSSSSRDGGEIAMLAARVAAGEIESPVTMGRRSSSTSQSQNSFTKPPEGKVTGTMSRQRLGKKYGPCPSLPDDGIITRWNALDALVYCVRFHTLGFSEDAFRAVGIPTNMGDRNIALHTPRGDVDVLLAIAATAGGGAALDAYIIQLIGLLASSELVDADGKNLPPASSSATAPRRQSLPTKTGTIDSSLSEETKLKLELTQKLGEEISDSLVEVLLQSDDYCQRLHFLLRSYIATVESKDDNAPFLRILRYAQRHLSRRLFDRATNMDGSRFGSGGYPLTREQTDSAMSGQSKLNNFGVVDAPEYPLQREAAEISSDPSVEYSIGSDYRDSSFDSFSTSSKTDEFENADGVQSSDSNRKNSVLEKRPQSPTNAVENDDLNKKNGGLGKRPQSPTKKKSKKIFRMFSRTKRGSHKHVKSKNSAGDESLDEFSKSPASSPVQPIAEENLVEIESPTSFGDEEHKSSTKTSNEPATNPPDEKAITNPTRRPQPTSILRNTISAHSRRLEQSETQLSPVIVKVPSTSVLFENMSRFLSQLDAICTSIEGTLLKTLSQKIADWALQPWTASKEKELAKVTSEMRAGLNQINGKNKGGGSDGGLLPLLNPVDSSEVLVSVDPTESYILPSAHFPLLLTFNMKKRQNLPPFFDGTNGPSHVTPDVPKESVPLHGEEILYMTRVEVVALRGINEGTLSVSGPGKNGKVKGAGVTGLNALESAYTVHGAIGGVVQETDRSTLEPYYESTTHRWYKGNVLTFENRSVWGYPKTLSLRLSSVSTNDDGHDQVTHTDENGMLHYSSEVGYAWVDLTPMWKRGFEHKNDDAGVVFRSTGSTVTCHTQILSFGVAEEFDQHGHLIRAPTPVPQRLELELKITNESINLDQEGFQRKRMLLYKHDDDLRQEMLAIQFIETCDQLMKASGLDLKMLTFRCLPVGANKGFIEWVTGSIPLSEICESLGSSFLGGSGSKKSSDGDEPSGRTNSTNTMDAKNDAADNTSGETENALKSSLENRKNSLCVCTNRTGSWCKYQSLRSMRQRSKLGKTSSGGGKGTVHDNPIQDFLRSAAYDPDSPYFIRKEVMDAYVKSCAGYCVITYLLGVGDRHLDNMLLHPNGHFLHCDYSFILGHDPKTYLPMRITEEMVQGMGGCDSDNFAMFLSLAGAAFVALRRHENVRVLLSLVRLLASSSLPDMSVNQSAADALMAMRYRFRLDLSEDGAITFMERLIESSIASKMWMAVDAIHSLGKRF